MVGGQTVAQPYRQIECLVVVHRFECSFHAHQYTITDAGLLFSDKLLGASIITLYRDDQKHGNPTQYRAMDLQRTLLSTAIGVEYLHILAARKEFLSFTFLHLSPGVLRKSGLARGPRFLSEDGSNLPTTLARMQAEDEFA